MADFQVKNFASIRALAAYQISYNCRGLPRQRIIANHFPAGAKTLSPLFPFTAADYFYRFF
jgi:hypothetical protein